MVGDLPARAGDSGSIPGSGRSPGGENGTRPRSLAWRIPRTGSLVGYSPWGCKESDVSEYTHTICNNVIVYIENPRDTTTNRP